ncbi:hypothetical protein AB4Z49_39435, partial [Cupriavidus sp. M-11]
ARPVAATAAARTVATPPKPAPPVPPLPPLPRTTEHVVGRLLEARTLNLAPSAPLAGLRPREAWWMAALMLLLVGAGAGVEWHRGRRRQAQR